MPFAQPSESHGTLHKKTPLTIIALIALMCAMASIFAVSFLLSTPATNANPVEEKSILVEQDPEAMQCVYLSDLPYTAGNVGWGTVGLDKNSANNKPLALRVNGSTVTFKKGIFAHARSEMVYDISEHADSYDYFSTYYGIDATSNPNGTGDGAKFYVYTSADGENWELRTDENPSAMEGNLDAGYAKIPLDGASYIKLVALPIASNASDHTEWADAKLIREGYTDNVTRTVEELDDEIKASYTGGPVPEFLQLKLLQRNLIASVGQYGLKDFIDAADYNYDTLEWFLNDEEALRLWTMGGTPNGTYMKSLQVLSDLYHTYKDDLADDTVSNGVRNGDLNLRMMLALSLAHARPINLWIFNNQTSNPVDRYEIFKSMYENGKLGNPRMFANFTVEELRWVMTAQMDDESILWLRDYTSKFGDGFQLSARFNPYNYITYRFGYSYGNPRYYAEANYAMWDKKYNLSAYNITYKTGYPKLWIVFEEGSVCGGLSKTGSNIQCAWGYPATPVGQPGHCAYIYMYDAGGGKNAWQLTNSIVANGWANTTPTMMPYGWGSGGANVTNNGTIQSASYMFLSQEAQNEYDKFEKANMLMLMAKVYRSDWDALVQIYNDAYEQEHINLDAWNGLINIALDSRTNSSQEELYALAEKCANDMKYHPLPMYDLTRRIGAKITDPVVKSNFMMLVQNTLQTASKATNAQSIQAKEINAVANALLGYVDNRLATFSFDGANAGQIVLGKSFQGSGTPWEYSLDGGATWTAMHEDAATLTMEQMNSITASNDVKVRISDAGRAGSIYTIDITQPSFSTAGLSPNDDENRFYGTTSLMEYYLTEDVSSNVVPADAEWLSFSTAPNLEGNKRLFVRNRRTGTQLATNYVWYTYHEEVVVENRNYIKPSHLSIAAAHGGAAAGAPANILDGNGNTYWLTGKAALPHYVTIALDEPKFLSGFDFVPKPLNSTLGVAYGLVRKYTISVSMDGTNWTDVVANRNAAGSGVQSTTFVPVQAKYVKFTCLAAASMNDGTLPLGAKGWMSLADVKLYEDLAADPTPRANVRYDIWSKTNHDVTAELVDATRPVTVTNTEDGSTTHTFTENGEFTFEFEDAAGNVGTATASVDWIDKTPPSMSVEYSTTEPTSDDVVATLSFSEPVEITSDSGIATAEDGTQTMTFVENGSVDVEFQDEVGNTASATVTVSNIDKESPTAQIEYSTTDITDGTVTATCVPDEDAEVTSEGGDTYVFDRNGTHVFEMVDAAGNVGTATAEVTWIKHMPVMHVEYSTTALTNGDVDAELVVESGDIRIMNNSGRSTYTFQQNGTFDFEYLDADGMSGRATAEVSNIDKEAPTATVSYDKTSPTNGNVTAVIEPSEDVEITSEGGASHTFVDNGEFEFTFVDAAGNEGTATASVDWIDREAPTATISYSTTEPTEGEVVATIFPSEDVTVTFPEDGSMTHAFTENGSFTFVFSDAAGNVGRATATVSWIAAPGLPEVSVTYSTTSPTRGNVTATLESDDEIEVLNGDDGTASHVFSDNGEFTFEFTDSRGNRGTAEASVSWIDRIPPTGSVAYSTTSPTNQDVTADLYIDGDEPVTMLGGRQESGILAAALEANAPVPEIGAAKAVFDVKIALSRAAKSSPVASHTFAENGEFEFAFADAAGNIGTALAKVDWIDKEAPTAEVSYSETEETAGPVIATLVLGESGIKVTSPADGSMTYTFTENGSFTFEFVDAAGNKGTATANVDWIRKDYPLAEVSVEYSTTSPTNRDVTATLVSDDEIEVLNGDAGGNSHVFDKNGEFSFEFVDSHGNRGTAVAKVDWIDREAKAGVEYRDVVGDNGKKTVIATLVPGEDGIEVTNNGGSFEYVFDENGEFTFEFADALGNQGTATAAVDWIPADVEKPDPGNPDQPDKPGKPDPGTDPDDPNKPGTDEPDNPTDPDKPQPGDDKDDEPEQGDKPGADENDNGNENDGNGSGADNSDRGSHNGENNEEGLPESGDGNASGDSMSGTGDETGAMVIVIMSSAVVLAVIGTAARRARRK